MTRQPTAPLNALRALAEVGAEYYRRAWMLGTAGNLSLRDARGGDEYWVTASGGHKGRLGPEDFLPMQTGMRRLEEGGRKTSAETIVHDELYAANTAIGSIHHVHSPYVTLVSRALGANQRWHIEGFEYIKGLGLWDEGASLEVPIVANHHDIPTLATAVVEAAAAFPLSPGVLVEGHGIYAWGETISAAQRHIECFEFLAQMTWEERFRS